MGRLTGGRTGRLTGQRTGRLTGGRTGRLTGQRTSTRQRRRTSRRASTRGVAALVALPVLVLLLATTRTWLTGRSAEPLLGGGDVAATGSQLAPGVMALALVCLVALVTTLTGGPVVRRVSAGAIVAAAAGAVVFIIGVLGDPQTALGRVAAAGLGRTGVVRTTASPTGWVWTALGGGVVLAGAGAFALYAAGRWGGLSGRFDAPGGRVGARTSAAAGPAADGPAADGPAADGPAADGPAADVRDGPVADGRAGAPASSSGAPTGRRATAWDDLSEGRDPTMSSPESPPGDVERQT